MDDKKIKLYIKRKDRYDSFTINRTNITLLEALYRVKNVDNTLKFRRGCHAGVCGSCAVQINGKPVLACKTMLSSGTYIVEPLSGFPVIEDLVVDKQSMFIEEKNVLSMLPTKVEIDNNGYDIFHRCISCGICQSICTTREYGLGARTRMKIADIVLDSKKKHLSLSINPTMAQNFFEFKTIPDNENLDIIYQNMLMCSACGKCETFCPKSNASIRMLELAKERLVLHNAKLIHTKLYNNMKTHNSYGEPHEKRFAWMPPDIKFDENADVGVFFGCSACYRTTECAIAVMRILKSLGIKVIASADEWCCGSTYLRTGLGKEIKEKNMSHNVALLQSFNVDTILTSCSGCFRTFNKDYLYFYGKLPFKVMHITQYLAQLIDKKNIILPKCHIKATFHDSCHMGRGMNEYNAPRKVLEAMGIKIIEMKHSKETSNCCGGGGGLKSGMPNLSLEIASRRVREALETDTDIIFTSCVFCTRNLNDAIKMMNVNMQAINIETFLSNMMCQTK